MIWVGEKTFGKKKGYIILSQLQDQLFKRSLVYSVVVDFSTEIAAWQNYLLSTNELEKNSIKYSEI